MKVYNILCKPLDSGLNGWERYYDDDGYEIYYNEEDAKAVVKWRNYYQLNGCEWTYEKVVYTKQKEKGA